MRPAKIARRAIHAGRPLNYTLMRARRKIRWLARLYTYVAVTVRRMATSTSTTSSHSDGDTSGSSISSDETDASLAQKKARYSARFPWAKVEERG